MDWMIRQEYFIRQEIKGIEKEWRLDFLHARALFFDNRNNIASLNDKIRLIETKELKVLHEKIQQKETILKELRDGILKLTLKTEGLIKEKNITNKFINTHAISRDEFLKEKLRIKKLIDQLDRKFKSLQWKKIYN